jgi:hypothetical protein
MGSGGSKPNDPGDDDVENGGDGSFVNHEGPYLFDYVITTIDVVKRKGNVDDSKYGKGAEFVELYGELKTKIDDDDVAFLVNLKEKEVFEDNPEFIIYQAISVTKETFQQMLIDENNKYLACVHGFQTSPEAWIRNTCRKIQQHEEFNYKVIPVIWPSVGRIGNILDFNKGYNSDRAMSKQAGKAMLEVGDLGTNISLSIMCHSMGNHFLFSYTQSKEIVPRFENVFMIAADVWEEVFNRRIIYNEWLQPPWNYWNEFKDTGLKLCNSLKGGGEIHIAHYRRDRALITSRYKNGRTRLGRYGKPGQKNRLDEDCAKKLVTIDMKLYEAEIRRTDIATLHNYEAMPTLIKYYAYTMGK